MQNVYFDKQNQGLHTLAPDKRDTLELKFEQMALGLGIWKSSGSYQVLIRGGTHGDCRC